jgi:hypothetical protein
MTYLKGAWKLTADQDDREYLLTTAAAHLFGMNQMEYRTLIPPNPPRSPDGGLSDARP